ncbi:parathyroid hormone/parathyroid hormone-related peptide receptor-like isoform X2 [Pomacea canaliculata]|uniref:parathyroid hormone/parathyroid hormone-related peptide receptor-like isoform X2 n=1 Tax=Pomacea canaliculata TaxID=400727 RepID=UPI000D73F736|nr:parathyroid hormone/parathyroid hormone-related peptide receptor-like isoform X2 [Pomacea canaliculata]
MCQVTSGNTSTCEVSELSEEEQIWRLGVARQQCDELMNTQPVTLTGLYCNRTWDNIMCWPDTPAGEVRRLPCPGYINRFDQSEFAVKHCLQNGSWFVLPTLGKPWTNFTACIEKHAMETVPQVIADHMPRIKIMYTVGYSMSLTTLILAVAIIIYFRRLHCARNMIHLNMFIAFLLRAAVSLMKNVLLVNDLGFPIDVNVSGARIDFIQEGTHWECKLFFTLFNYVIFTSVMWLFNEGLYLVLILSVSVFAEKTKIRWFVILGWGFPMLFIIPWVVCRIKLDDMLCWNVHMSDELFWILRAPIVASVAINFLFFINIVRMLFTKLTATNCPESKKVRYRKLAKSTLILIPLFAVYYMAFIWIPDDLNPTCELIRIYIEMLFNSLQGFLVALLFCFLNTEVQNEIRKKWHRHVLNGTGSWNSTPSVGSFFRRSANARDKKLHHSSRLDSRSVIESECAHSSFFPTVVTTQKQNGHLTTICEESVLLTGFGVLGNKAPVDNGRSSGQDHNENRRNYESFDVGGEENVVIQELSPLKKDENGDSSR